MPEQPVDDVDHVAVMHIVHRENERGPAGNTKRAWLSIEAVKHYVGGQPSLNLLGKSVGICGMPDSKEVVGRCRHLLERTPRCGANAELDEAGSARTNPEQACRRRELLVCAKTGAVRSRSRSRSECRTAPGARR